MARIVLAEDDRATRDLVKRALEQDGHEVFVTQDGQEALEHFGTAKQRPDILVSDVHMPGLDGFSLARRAIEAVPTLSILLMSGFPEELERAKGINAQRVGVLSKPFSLEQIRAAVRQLIA
jgi:two-component system, cell cycle response regulator CpdR